MSAESLFPFTPEHWRVTTLGELAKSAGGGIQTGPFGSQLHAKDYVDDGIPSIMPKNIAIDSVLTDDIARVSREDIDRLAKYKVQTGDIVYSRRGDVEKCVRITPRENGWLCGTGCLRVRVPPVEVPHGFLHAYLCHPHVREWIVRHAVGATMPNLNTSILSALPVVVPSKPEMEAISSIWLAVSENIQLNQKINQTLEQMAQAIFKSWFVDFEPVKAKIAARERWYALQSGNESTSPACYSGELADQPINIDLDTYMNYAAMQAISGKDAAQLAQMQAEKPEEYEELFATAELFPSAMQDSELGEIPEGWECLSLDAIASYQNGLALQKYRPENEDEYLPIVKIAQLKKGMADAQEKASPHIKPDFIIDDGDVVFSWSGSLMVDTWCGGKAALNQHLFKVTSKSYPKWLYYYFTKHHLDEFQRIAAAKAVTMGHIKREHLKLALCAVPKIDLITKANPIVGTLLDKQISVRLESSNLILLRDTLLPKLLSGELSVADIKSEVEA